MDAPIIETPRLTLRGFTQEDLDPLHAILQDRDVILYMLRTEPWAREIVQRILDGHWKHWDERGYGWWAVDSRETNELIGWCGLGYLSETNETEVKYLLKKSHWGRGLASEAAAPCVRAAFEDVKVDELVGIVHPENVASQKVLEKQGLMFTRRCPYFGFDMIRYAIDRDTYERSQSA
jgi:ribosomal-protein-alanine N-acetyltransferase